MRTKWHSLAMVVWVVILASSPLNVKAASPADALPSGVATVTGFFSINPPSPDFDANYIYHFQNLYIRVEGTDISTKVDQSGSYTLNQVPSGVSVTLLVEEPQGQDLFTTQSKRYTLIVPANGKNLPITLAWKWYFSPQPQLPSDRMDYLASYFTSPNTGWLLLDYWNDIHTQAERRLYQTTDGLVWSQIYSWPNYTYPIWPGTVMAFVDKTHNWIAGDSSLNKGGISIALSDGSRYWYGLDDAYPLVNRKNTFVTHIAAIDGDHIIASGYEVKQDDSHTPDVLWESGDNGVTWQVKQTDLPVVTALGAAPDGHAVAELNDGANCKTAFRNPADGTWNLPLPGIYLPWCINSSRRIPYSQGIFFAAADGGGAPGLYYSDDGGQTWPRLTTVDTGPVSFATSSMGWAVTGSGSTGDPKTLKVTYDGGRTWSLQASAPALPSNVVSGEGMDIFAVDTNIVYWRTANSTHPLMTFNTQHLSDLEVLVLPQRSPAAPNSALAPGQFNFPVMSLQIVNQGDQPVSNLHLTLHRSGTGINDLVQTVAAFWDVNSSGAYDTGDTPLDVSKPFPATGASVTFSLGSLTVSARQSEIVGIKWDTVAGFPLVDGSSYGLSLKPAADVTYGASSHPTAPAAWEIKTELDNLELVLNDRFNDLTQWKITGGGWAATGTNGCVSPDTSAYLAAYDGPTTTRILSLIDSVYLPPSNKIRLIFWNRYELFHYSETDRVWAHVDISTDAGLTWTHLQEFGTGNGLALQSAWFEQVIDLTTYFGRHVLLRFTFQQASPGLPNVEPRFWNLDDVRLAYDSGSTHYFYLPAITKMP